MLKTELLVVLGAADLINPSNLQILRGPLSKWLSKQARNRSHFELAGTAPPTEGLEESSESTRRFRGFFREFP